MTVYVQGHIRRLEKAQDIAMGMDPAASFRALYDRLEEAKSRPAAEPKPESAPISKRAEKKVCCVCTPLFTCIDVSNQFQRRAKVIAFRKKQKEGKARKLEKKKAKVEAEVDEASASVDMKSTKAKSQLKEADRAEARAKKADGKVKSSKVKDKAPEEAASVRTKRSKAEGAVGKPIDRRDAPPAQEKKEKTRINSRSDKKPAERARPEASSRAEKAPPSKRRKLAVGPAEVEERRGKPKGKPSKRIRSS
jgi:hypothetical protein